MRLIIPTLALLALVSSIGTLVGCIDDDRENEATVRTGTVSETAGKRSPAHQRQAYFGDLHIHSSWSIDAYGSGVRVGPSEAYRYAQGKPIAHVSGAKIQLAGPPLDFMALTDHAEYLGVIRATEKLSSPLHTLGLFQNWMGRDPDAARVAWIKIKRSFDERVALAPLATNEVVVPAWQELVEMANQHDRPGTFTAFVGYEYTSNPEAQNLHRNIIFRGSQVPDRPFTAMDSSNPEDLWRWMDDVRSKGDDLIAIPHNANGSNGLMFARTRYDGSPIDRVWADQRIRNEPVAEVMQIKGQSETRQILSPDDEWADFEVVPWRTLNPAFTSQPSGSYVRDALKTGLQLRGPLGQNPYALGMIGSTDGHNASSPFEEQNYTGKIGDSDGTPERRLATADPMNPFMRRFSDVSIFWSAAGLAGIWADANTREDLFDSLRRRETFSTSGPRIRVRLFGGWNFKALDAESDIARRGYDEGVPMGGELPAISADEAPTFLLAALKDPLEADLERIQIIKGWTEGEATREQVFDVACADGAEPNVENHRCPNRASAPDLSACEPDSTYGTREFNAWWRDPSFDPTERAFYYVRVLQVPTCRWSTYDANRLGISPPKIVPAAIQERAITSPIWYEPS
jgi:hypothetical protein